MEQVWQTAMGLRLDQRAAELIEAASTLSGGRRTAREGAPQGRQTAPPLRRAANGGATGAKKPAAKRPGARQAHAGTRKPAKPGDTRQAEGRRQEDQAARGRTVIRKK